MRAEAAESAGQVGGGSSLDQTIGEERPERSAPFAIPDAYVGEGAAKLVECLVDVQVKVQRAGRTRVHGRRGTWCVLTTLADEWRVQCDCGAASPGSCVIVIPPAVTAVTRWTGTCGV